MSFRIKGIRRCSGVNRIGRGFASHATARKQCSRMAALAIRWMLIGVLAVMGTFLMVLITALVRPHLIDAMWWLARSGQ